MLWLWAYRGERVVAQTTGRQTLTTVGRLEEHMHGMLGPASAVGRTDAPAGEPVHDPPMSKLTKRSVHGHAG
jgi:hypothetical protein